MEERSDVHNDHRPWHGWPKPKCPVPGFPSASTASHFIGVVDRSARWEGGLTPELDPTAPIGGIAWIGRWERTVKPRARASAVGDCSSKLRGSCEETG